MKKGGILLSFLSFVAIFSVIACKGSSGGGSQLKDFDVVSIKLWEEDVKSKDALVVVSEKATSKVLEIEVSNCDNYKVTVSLGGKAYTGTSSLGIVEIPIEDIKTEEKPLIIKLVGSGMNDFRKSFRVKKKCRKYTTSRIQFKKD